MSLEELGFRVDELTFQFEERKARQAAKVREFKAEATALKGKIREQIQRLALPRPRPPTDSTFVRRVEWRIADVSTALAKKDKNEAVWSDPFLVMGVKMQLEFFPKGRESTSLPGFCGFFLWCPGGVRLTYQLFVGNHKSAPDSDDYASHMGHGHSNFCHFASQVDQSTDSLLLGVDILSIAVTEDCGDGVKLINNGPESIVRRKAALLTNRYIGQVEWRVRDILKRVDEVPRGCSICSPPMSLAGIPEIFLELYPNGVQIGNERPDPEKAGFCGFYVRCPSGCTLNLTLFVGSAKKGPIRTDFGGDAAKGLPAFCKLMDHIAENGKDLICGVAVENPALLQDAEVMCLES